MISSILNSVISLVNGWFESKKAEQETRISVEKDRARLAISRESFNSEWEKNALINGDKWVKRFSFVMFSAPFVVAMFSPISVKTYFTIAISSIPRWYVETYVVITGSVWGVSALKNNILEIFKTKK